MNKGLSNDCLYDINYDSPVSIKDGTYKQFTIFTSIALTVSKALKSIIMYVFMYYLVGQCNG